MKETLEHIDTLVRLKDDNEYYGAFGRKFISNSDIGTLLKNPMQFRVPRPDNPVFAIGRYFHQLILEPEKAKEVTSLNVSSRNTKVYKEYLKETGKPMSLLDKEVEATQQLVDRMKMNYDFFDGIYKDGNRFEVPAVTKILGVDFKGKADIECDDCLIDLKTTADIYKFKYSAYSYNYDSQCYIYQVLFGKPLKFYVIDKNTLLMGIFSPSEEFVERGKDKVYRAIKVYERFFAKDAPDDVQDFFIEETL